MAFAPVWERCGNLPEDILGGCEFRADASTVKPHLEFAKPADVLLYCREKLSRRCTGAYRLGEAEVLPLLFGPLVRLVDDEGQHLHRFRDCLFALQPRDALFSTI